MSTRVSSPSNRTRQSRSSSSSGASRFESKVGTSNDPSNRSSAGIVASAAMTLSTTCCRHDFILGGLQREKRREVDRVLERLVDAIPGRIDLDQIPTLRI